MTRRSHLAAVVLLVGAVVGAGAPATEASEAPLPPTASVVVDGHTFDPAEARVARGGTIRFVVDQAGHTVVADDGSFTLRGPGGGTVPAGTTHEVTMDDEDEIVSYYCEIHPSMRGRIIVGRPTLGGSGSVIRVPEDASLADAALLAAPGDTIDVAPGRHVLDEPLVIAGERVTVRGRSGSAADVVLSAGERLLRTAIELSGRQTELADLTIVAGRSSAVRATPSGQGLAMRNVTVVTGPVSHRGVDATGVAGLRLDDVRFDGLRDDAIRVRACPACGLWISDVDIVRSRTGIRLVDVGGALVQSSRIEMPVDGVVATGVGGMRLVDNTVAGAERYGVVLAGGPAIDTTVGRNDLRGSGGPDLAWDGIGTRTCFDDNEAADTSPPTLTDTASCDRANPWSPPWPLPIIDQTRP